MTADTAIAVAVPEDVARSFLAPDGVLLRMRALAVGWTNPGDKIRAPNDTAWWGATYRFPLWNPLGTYVDGISAALAATGATPGVAFNEAAARGDSAAISRIVAGMREELAFLEGKDPDCKPGDLCQAPCPPWLIPPGKRGTMPLPNPDCAVRDVERRKRELEERQRNRADTNKQKGIDQLIIIGVLVLAYFAGRKVLR